MSLEYEDDKIVIKGYYNKNEENFISKYFLSFGNEILVIKPIKLKN